MPAITPVQLVVLATLSVVLVLFSERRQPALEWIFKPLASLCFVALALVAGALESVYGQILLLGLVLCLAGDVFLIASGDRTFLLGLGSFLLGHLAYAAAFFQLPWSPVGLWVSIPPVLVLAVASLRWLWPHVAKPMKGPVVAYVAVICGMLLMAGTTWGSSPAMAIVIGAWGFAVSDLAVARNQFVAPGFGNRLWGLPLYFGAQLLLAWSVQA